ncbi:MAG: class I adenylate-forming enzyme family protein, partial [Rhizomicrobium sp.]
MMAPRPYPGNPAFLPPGFQPMTFGNAIRAACARNPAKVAIVHNGRQRTYGDLVKRIDALRDAAAADLGLVKGDTVALVSRNCIEYLEIVAGIPDAGAAVATINARMTPREIRNALDDSRARVVIADEPSLPLIAAADLNPAIRVIALGNEYEALLANAGVPTSLPRIEEWDVWTIPYTSGTTGQPKGVMLSHRSRMLVGLVSGSEFGCFGYDDKFLAMTPMNHGGGLGFPASSLAAGGTVEILDKYVPLETLDRLKNGGVTGIFMVPTHFQMIFELPADVIEPYRLPPIRAIIANAAPLPQAMKEKIIPWFGEGVLNEIYGSTESGLVCNMRPHWHLGLNKAQCVGTPMPHVHVEIRREDGTICDVDEVGELFSRSPLNFNGYWHRDAETAAAIQGDWLTVGDMARRDADGFIYIVDRKKDMVISGGVNIYPREIEEVLIRHPAILEVAVVGIPDEKWGETLKTFATLREGASLTAEDIAAFCDGKLTAYKIP